INIFAFVLTYPAPARLTATTTTIFDKKKMPLQQRHGKQRALSVLHLEQSYFMLGVETSD
ncbi:MAG: hypothetical protein LUB61_04330, partial [Eggerthellaceae bacterium]|nr:hypothetical protein [Eggerthellaceae bacterium]